MIIHDAMTDALRPVDDDGEAHRGYMVQAAFHATHVNSISMLAGTLVTIAGLHSCCLRALASMRDPLFSVIGRRSSVVAGKGYC